jgi:hypothetical protein
MPSERTLRGALAGAVAAGVWAAQQPLDKRAFGVAYDDCELLGTLFTRGRYAYRSAWPAIWSTAPCSVRCIRASRLRFPVPPPPAA